MKYKKPLNYKGNYKRIGKLVKSDSSMKWVPFMVKYESGTRFFGLLKKYDFAYIHPSISDLPNDFLDYKIGDKVEFYNAGEIHVKLISKLLQ